MATALKAMPTGFSASTISDVEVKVFPPWYLCDFFWMILADHLHCPLICCQVCAACHSLQFVCFTKSTTPQSVGCHVGDSMLFIPTCESQNGYYLQVIADISSRLQHLQNRRPEIATGTGLQRSSIPQNVHSLLSSWKENIATIFCPQKANATSFVVSHQWEDYYFWFLPLWNIKSAHLSTTQIPHCGMTCGHVTCHTAH